MNSLIHYTSTWAWEQIKESGVLLPRSTPREIPVTLTEDVEALLSAAAYLVGIPSVSDQRWTEYGLMEYLLKQTAGEVILEVPILAPGACFVRDHASASPKMFIERDGVDLWKELFEGRIAYSDPRIERAVQEYYKSTVPLGTYSGNYNVPEIWVHQETPLDKIRVLKAPPISAGSFSARHSL